MTENLRYNALAVIKAQQIAAKIIVIANAVSVVLGAVADKDSSETGSDDTAQTTESDKVQK